MDYKKALLSVSAPIVLAGSAMAAYTGDYAASDFDDVVFDFMGNIGVEGIAFAGSIVSILFLVFMLRKILQARNTSKKLL